MLLSNVSYSVALLCSSETVPGTCATAGWRTHGFAAICVAVAVVPVVWGCSNCSGSCRVGLDYRWSCARVSLSPTAAAFALRPCCVPLLQLRSAMASDPASIVFFKSRLIAGAL